MFSRTVSHGNTPYSWKMTPRSGPGPAIARPSSSTRPCVGATKPATMFNIVVLPHPDGPMTATNSPSRMSYDTSSTTRIGPRAEANSIDTRSNTMRGAAALIPGRAPRCGDSPRTVQSSRRGAVRASGSATRDGWRARGSAWVPTDTARRAPVGWRLRTSSAHRTPSTARTLCDTTDSRDPLLPRDQPARERAQHEVHRERDQADADDADVDDVELEERRCVLDQRAEPLLRGDELGGDERRPRDTERDTQRREQVRHGERHDDLAEDLRVGGAERARHAHVDRADLRDALVHDDHAREERCVEQDHDLRDLADAEVHDDERDQRDRRQRAEKVHQRIDEEPHAAIPAEHEAHGHCERDAEHDSDQHSLRRHHDIDGQARRGEELPEPGRDVMRRGHERRVDETGIRDRVPDRDDDKPGQRDQCYATSQRHGGHLTHPALAHTARPPRE